ncbi:MAG: 23S rRNA (uracil(1939)-C(5))-methyltransferase RlmD [Bacteroidales bacterium]|nr:23S rRNA (uracil(1939)-C(5))-methyltransferase RlmD [Bacteroidales bacterium]
MTRKKKQLPMLQAVTITDVAAEGKALARVDDLVVFVPFAAPGDVVDIQLTKKKQHYAEGYVVKLITPSAVREEPFCRHFGVCGGCKWQHLPYPAQLAHKHKQVCDALERIGKQTLPPSQDGHLLEVKDLTEGTYPIIGSARTRHYRNKLEFTFSDARWMSKEEMNTGETITNRNALGFHIPGMFDKVLDIDQCWLQAEPSNQIRLAVKAYCEAHDLAFFNLRRQEGLMRNLIIRTSSTGELMVILVFFKDLKQEREALLQHLSDTFPSITSLMYVVNEKCNDSLSDQEVVLFSGKDHMMERMEELSFKVGPKSFYQTNSDQAYVLYQVARKLAGLTGDELVYDLYTGTGTIAQFLAKSCKQVIGVEYVQEAIDDALINASLNNLTNTRFFAGDMKDVLTPAFVEEHGHPDVIVTDPPRAGMHEDVVKTILMAAPKRIVYVSCNPATQARDLALLNEAYRLAVVQPVDLFPHTQHVENVALLVAR